MASRTEAELSLELTPNKATTVQLEGAQAYNTEMIEEMRVLEDRMRETVSDMDHFVEELA